MIITTTNEIPGKKVSQILGVAKGNTVRSRNIGRDIAAALKSMVGGEIKSFTDLLTQAREEAFNRMVNNAISLGADAVIGMKFMTAMIMAGSSEILAYGTAVKLK